MFKKFRSKSKRSSNLSVYANLTNKRRSKKDQRSRRKAEYLASLPKHPVKRFFYRLHPKRFFAFWFSREGGIMALKIAGIIALLLFVFAGALFAYYRRELDAIRPDELAKRVQTTVTRYYDRNGILLWEDRGDGNYRLTVKSDEISKYMKEATVAIEDKDFYHHHGISVSGIARSVINNFTGGYTQGGSTLTQQLVKQVFFSSEEAQKRGLNGVPRKIKEVILAIEVERIYDKDQILTLYLNESPYGGRRNGVESAAQAYFGKHAKDLDLAESALLASIPQFPGYYDPYTTDPEALKQLIARQHIVLDKMSEQGYITADQAKKAKAEPILDTIQSEPSAYADTIAPHFVQMVRQQLVSQLGKVTVGNGGLVVKTTLDARVQKVVNKAVVDLFKGPQPAAAHFDNAAATIVDVPTGQILAMRGSRDYNYPGYGFDNAATGFLQPGSSIKPFVYSALFKGNYGAGSVLSDENIDKLVGYHLANFDNRYRGNIPIRSALAESRNIPAVKAYLIAGKESVLDTIHSMGDPAYCTQGTDAQAGPALAIGGCTLHQYQHANAFATIARMGVYKPVSSILEVKNAQGQVLEQWKDDQAKQVIDPQIPYILADILSDDAARAPSFGFGAQGLVIPGVKTGTKTGTSNLGNFSRDLWINSFTPKAALSIWAGNHDGAPMSDALSYRLGPTVAQIMSQIHLKIFEKDGSWKPGAWFKKPAGVQTLTVNGHTDLFPSWYQKPKSQQQTMTFDKVSKKKATSCTPSTARVEITVTKYTDPVTKKDVLSAPDGYNPKEDDDYHKCSDSKPFVGSIDITPNGPGPHSKNFTISVMVSAGTHPLKSLEFRINGQLVKAMDISASGQYSIDYSFSEPPDDFTVSVKAIDKGLYETTGSKSYQN